MIKYFQNARDYISSFSHFLGVIMGIILMLAYIAKGIYDNSNLLTILGSIIFALSIILLYAASSFYHYIPKNSKHFLLFRKLDHSMIYILIAGSYTPVCLRFLEINHAITFLAIIWSIAFVGIILKFCWLNSPRILYTLLYLMMGWAVIFDFKSFAIIPSSCLLLITIGGIAYTIGGIIYIVKKPNLTKSFGFHELFHIFILIGTLFHGIACLNYMV